VPPWPRYSTELIEAVRARSPIEDIAAEHLQLRHNGLSFIGRCPFHGDRTPSFTLHPGKQVFHCHGCKAGGDVFRFVELLLHCTFRQAVEHLAGLSGIAIEGFKPSPELVNRVAEKRVAREAELAFTSFAKTRIATVNAQYRALSRAVTNAEDYLRTGAYDPYLHGLAWETLERFRIFEVRLEREGLLDPTFLRAEWENRHAAA
jgi:DNA primase